MIHTARPDPSLLEFSLQCTAEWRSPQQNVLLEGPDPSTRAVLRVLAPRLRAPVRWKSPEARFAAPAGKVGALILQNVDALCADEQRQLLHWIDARPETQIVSTAACRLFDLVASWNGLAGFLAKPVMAHPVPPTDCGIPPRKNTRHSAPLRM